MGLSIFERAALKKLTRTEWVSAYECKIGLDTLHKLVDKGYISKRNDLGYISSPLTSVKFRKKLSRRQQNEN